MSLALPINGINNANNTCFMNSCIQILFQTPEFAKFLYHTNQVLDTIDSGIQEPQYGYKTTDSFLHTRQLLLLLSSFQKEYLKQNMKIVTFPQALLCIIAEISKLREYKFVQIHKFKFAGQDRMHMQFIQNDFPEFFAFLVDNLHRAIARKVAIVNPHTGGINQKCMETLKQIYEKEYSEFWEMFNGIQVSQLISCETGNVVSNTPDPFMSLSLELDDPRTGDDADMLARASAHEEEPQDGDQKTDRIEEDKKVSPKTLLSCLRHYTDEEELDTEILNDATGKREKMKRRFVFWKFPKILVIYFKRFDYYLNKNNEMVDFPFEMELVTCENVMHKFKLYAVANHYSIGMHGGHYTAFVRQNETEWYHINDTIITKIDESQVVTQAAYILFYRME